MRFSTFSKYLQKLESTSKRLEITDILSNLITEIELNEIDKALYMTMGMLGPLFDNKEFALAEKMMARTVALAYNMNPKEVIEAFEKSGDLGDVAEVYANKASSQDKKLSVVDVFNTLYEIAGYSGTGSQDKKISRFADLLRNLEPLSVKYAVRIPTKNLRLGFSEITVIEALSWSVTKDKSLKTKIEQFYHMHPDIGKIAHEFKKGGLEALKQNVSLEVGVPVLPQLCQRVATAEEAIDKLEGTACVEYKYDGTRVQLHLDRKRTEQVEENQLSFFGSGSKMPFVRTFTRNLENSTHMFPDVIREALDNIDASSVILDGEAVGFDPKTGKLIPFQETSQRKRKHQILEKVTEIPLRYFVFDLLFLNGKSLLNIPFSERRELLKKIVKPSKSILVDDQKVVNDPEVLLEEFKKAKALGLEGLVMKRPDSPYEAGGRGYTWIKFKREETGGLEDTVDVVIMGYYFGRGDRAKFGIGGFLVGVFDPEKEKFVSVSKVGSGPTEEEWAEIKKRADSVKSTEMPSNYEVNKLLFPDVWAKPKHLAVIRADEITVSDNHTAGYALRFPRLIQFREDKRPTDTTTPEEIKRLYELQKKH